MRVRFEVWAPGLLFVATGYACDPGYEYCVDVTDCASGGPVSDVLVRFDHEDLREQSTDEWGHACSANVGEPRAHTVHIALEKDGYRPLLEAVESSGLELHAALCICRTADSTCVDGTPRTRDGGLDPADARSIDGSP